MIINERLIGEIKPYKNNAKYHPETQIKQIANSIKEFGFNQPIVVDNNDVIIVGHGRYLAAKELGLEKVPVLAIDIDENKAKTYRLADNKLNESDWDMQVVIDELKLLPLPMIDLSGFSRDLILTSDEKDDHIPEAPKEAKSKPGDLYEIGRHRVLCGDSTKQEDVDKLMGQENAKLIFTSPPYNIGGGMYASYEDNLKKEEYINFNIKVLREFQKHLKGFVFWNISYNKNSRDSFIEIIYRIIKETGLKFLELIVWDKKHALPITSKEMMTRQYEDILLVGDEESVQRDLEFFFCGRNDKTAWFNKKTQKGLTNFWQIGTNKTQLENHLACYPVALPMKGIIIMTSEKDIVADPFLGSGTTMIACEKSGRTCYGMELDPIYCDVIVQRYVEFTGNHKIKLNDKEIVWT
jgi:DNA modification methylase